MKYLCALLFCMLTSLAAIGQQANPMFYKEILLLHKPYTLQSITEEMQAQSGISFSYNADDIDPRTRIKIKADRITVAEMLALIKKQTGISCKMISGRHIIYAPAPSGKKQKVSKPQKIKKVAKHRQHKHTDATPLVATNGAVIMERTFTATHTITDSATDATIIVVGDSGLVSAYYNGGGGSGSGGNYIAQETEPEEAAPIPQRKWRSSTSGSYKNKENAGTKKMLHFVADNTLLAIGASFDETYYFNPGLRFGMRFLYGIASYSMGSDKNSLRYGIGASAKIDDSWSMHFAVTTGPSVAKTYSIPSADTAVPNTPLVVTSRLTRYAISTAYHFGNSFSIEGGLTFNSLKTHYSSHGAPVTLSDILPAGYDADKRYPGIKPPYVMGNSYSGNTTSNTKTWIGIQVTLLYQLRFSDQ